MASSRSGGGDNGLREGLLMSGTLTGQKVNYLDSGYSEEDPSEQPSVTSCLVKTSSGSVYIPPSKYQKIKICNDISFAYLMDLNDVKLKPCF